jgi:hypothetical protein
MLLVPSVDVTNGEPHPFVVTLHTGKVTVGGLVAVILNVASFVLLSRNATYVACAVR